MENPQDKQNGKKGTTLGLDENLEGLLCYALGWVSGFIFLLLEKENKFVRFHAMQSLATFLTLFIIGMIPIIGWLLNLILLPVSLVLWLWLMYKAYNGELYKLPIAGDFAEKQINK